MKRTWSDDSASSSGTPSGVNENATLALSIPLSSAPLLGASPLDSVNTATSPAVTASSTRRRYSWNVNGEEERTHRATAQRGPIARLSAHRLPPLSDEDAHVENHNSHLQTHGGNIEAGLFTDVVLSPVASSHFPDFNLEGSSSLPDERSTDSNPRHQRNEDNQYSSSDNELYELETLNHGSHQPHPTRSSSFQSTSSYSTMGPKRASSRRARYPSIRTHGLQSNGEHRETRRRSLRDRASDLVRQISQRVVNSRAEEDEEENRPLNDILQEGDVQSDSGSDDNTPSRSSQATTRDALGMAVGPPQHDPVDEQKMLEVQAQRQEVDELIHTLLQQVTQTSVPVAQATVNEGKTLGLFGTDNAIRRACKALVANRYVQLQSTRELQDSHINGALLQHGRGCGLVLDIVSCGGADSPSRASTLHAQAG